MVDYGLTLNLLSLSALRMVSPRMVWLIRQKILSCGFSKTSTLSCAAPLHSWDVTITKPGKKDSVTTRKACLIAKRQWEILVVDLLCSAAGDVADKLPKNC